MLNLKELNHKLELGSSPHIHARVSTQRSMIYVILALIPSLLAGCFVFGFMQIAVVATAVLFAVLTELAIKKMRKKPVTLNDYSAVLTGLLLGLIIPPYSGDPYIFVMAALGSIFAISIGKEIFGGLGFNIFNPALLGRAFLHISFGDYMGASAYKLDAVTTATPLAVYKEMIKGAVDKVAPSISDLFTGNIAGSIGETSAIAILVGGIFLLITGIINWRIPLSMVLGVVVFGGLFWLTGKNVPDPLVQLLSGGFLFAAFFMATDWVTSPLTNKGLWIYGLSISLIIVLIRMLSAMPEGVMFAIIFVNGFVPLINKYTRPKFFGEGYKYE